MAKKPEKNEMEFGRGAGKKSFDYDLPEAMPMRGIRAFVKAMRKQLGKICKSVKRNGKPFKE